MIRQIATLLTGNALAQLVNIATILVAVTAFFSPSEFGRYAVLMSYVGILSVVACLRYELSIVSVTLDRVSNNMVFSSTLIAVTISLLVYLAFKLAERVFGDDFLMGATPAIIAGLILLRAIDQICASVLYRNEAYMQYSILKLLQALVLLAGFVVTGLAGKGTPGLLHSTIIAYLAFAAAGVIAINRFNVLQGVRLNRALPLMRKHVDFVKFNAPQALVDNFLAHGLNFVLVGLVGPAVVGYFNYLQKTLKAPLGLIFGAVSQVVFRFTAKNKANPEFVAAKLRQVLRIAISIVFLAALAVGLVYAFFMEFEFLREWAGLRQYMLAFAVWMLVPFLFSSFATLPIVYERQKRFFQLATTFNLLSLAVLALIIWKGDVNSAFLTVGLASIVYYAGLNAWLFRIAVDDPAS